MKEQSFFVRPAPGRRVRDPITLKVLADEGEHKPQSSYWLRRLRDGDVIEGKPKPEMKAEKKRKAVEDLTTMKES